MNILNFKNSLAVKICVAPFKMASVKKCEKKNGQEMAVMIQVDGKNLIAINFVLIHSKASQIDLNCCY